MYENVFTAGIESRSPNTPDASLSLPQDLLGVSLRMCFLT